MITLVLGLLSLAMTAWVANDAARRHRQWFGWAALVWFTSVIGLIVWLVVRRHSPVVSDRPGVWRAALIAAAATIPLFLFSIMLDVFIVTFLLQVPRNEGHGMEPTLEDQDRLIVNMLAYRMGEPRRGDVVMHYYPLNPARLFVKRVIAEEGDTLRIVDGRVYVNDVLLRDDYVLPEYRSHDDFGPTVISEGYYFVMGDHRNNNSDSRHWGLVPKKYIVGKIIARFGGRRGGALIGNPTD